MNQPRNAGHVSASYVNLLFDWLAASHPELLRVIPFERPAPGELNRVEVTKWSSMLEWTFQQLKDPAMPLLIASHVRPVNMGLLGYVASCCNTLGEAFARLQQFENLVYSVNSLTVDLQGASLVLRWGEERGRPGHWVDSVAIGVLVAFTRLLAATPVAPLRVQFINPQPVNLVDFERFFNCPVVFNGAVTEVELPVGLLNMPLKAPDSVLRSLLDQQAQMLLKQVKAGEEAIVGLSKAIQEAVTAGLPTLQAVADKLHVSPRTLQRQLQRQGTSFSRELEKVRISMAQHLLREGELGLADIASFLSYNDQSAFSHAFKRAVGKTPARYHRGE